MKKGFELSVSMLIVIVLGFAVLGFGLYFISRLMTVPIPEVPQQCDIYPPNANQPICVSDNVEVSRGSQFSMSIAFYNNEDNDITSATVPSLVCANSVNGNTLDIKSSAAGMNVKVTEVGQYKFVVSVPKDAAREMYPCTLKISETEEQFTLSIK